MRLPFAPAFRALMLALVVAIPLAGCNPLDTAPEKVLDPDLTTATYDTALHVNIAAMTRVGDGVYIQDLVVGTGAAAAAGDTVSAHYVGWTSKGGAPFDASRSHSPPEPFKFKLGVNDVIPGWDEGIVGMKVGGKRKLVIPPSLAYGSRAIVDQSTGRVLIPANSILVFDVELVGVK